MSIIYELDIILFIDGKKELFSIVI